MAILKNGRAVRLGVTSTLLLAFSGAIKSVAPTLPVDLTLGAVAVVTVLSVFLLLRGKLPALPVSYPLLAIGLVGSLFHSSWSEYSQAKLIGGLLPSLLLFFAGTVFFKSPEMLLRGRNQLLALTLLLSGIGFLGDGAAFGRAALGGNTIRLGQVAGVAFVLTGAALSGSSHRKRASTFLVVVTLVGLLALMISSGSRGPLVAAIGAVALVALHGAGHGRRLRFVAVVLVILVGGAIGVRTGPDASTGRLTDTTSGSTTLRADAYGRSLTEILKNPLGVGFGDFGDVVDTFAAGERQYPHNLFLEVGVEAGWLAMAALIALCIGGLRRAARGEQATGWLLSLILYLLISASLSGDLSDNRFLLLAVGIAFAQSSNKQPSTEGTMQTLTDQVLRPEAVVR